MLPRSTWRYHEILRMCTQRIQSFGKTLEPPSCPCIIPWTCSQKQDNPEISPEEQKVTKRTSCYRFTWKQDSTVPLHLEKAQGTLRAQLADAGHQFPLVCVILSRNEPKVCKQPPLSLHLSAWVLGCYSCPSIDSS